MILKNVITFAIAMSGLMAHAAEKHVSVKNVTSSQNEALFCSDPQGSFYLLDKGETFFIGIDGQNIQVDKDQAVNNGNLYQFTDTVVTVAGGREWNLDIDLLFSTSVDGYRIKSIRILKGGELAVDLRDFLVIRF